MKGLQTEKEGTDGGMREKRLQEREPKGWRVIALVGEGVCVRLYMCVLLWESSVKSIHAHLNGILSPSLSPSGFPFFFFRGGGSSFKIYHSLADVPFFHHLVILSVSPSFSLLCFLSFSRTTFLLSCLSWPYVCDVMQDKGAKFGWDVKLWESDGQRERMGKS